ncbi:DUF4339 domain-containing protein [Flavobacterium luteolum]|uniref:DUF4339 domain-containing protein n=1 Tax=Flavobacterium luteolum TaxID=3003259 RepID=UPI00248EBDDC|nr:DUF4339 domain-containing protein [Flavobacterium luteolum]
MREYYLHKGIQQEGPYTIDELKNKNITRQTSIWYEGLPEWTAGSNIEELSELFKVSPPDFTPAANIGSNTNNLAAEGQKRNGKTTLKVVGILGLLVIVLIAVANTNNNSDQGNESYIEKVITIEEAEQSQPQNFLAASGNYNENFWGTKLKVHGLIKNNATVATYKDAVVKITYYSKTKTALGSKEYTIYEVFDPHSEKAFELKIDNYKDVESIGWEVITATAM